MEIIGLESRRLNYEMLSDVENNTKKGPPLKHLNLSLISSSNRIFSNIRHHLQNFILSHHLPTRNLTKN